jgi:hypothetical protein
MNSLPCDRNNSHNDSTPKRIFVEVDGAEFFTDMETGISGISQSGLAILCGVNKSTISRLIKTSLRNPSSQWLEPLQDNVHDLLRQTNSGVVLCSEELCVAVIKHYAFKGNEKAQFTLDKFVSIGFNHWVQSITGWNSDSTQVSLPRQPEELYQLLKGAFAEALAEHSSKQQQEDCWTPPPLYPEMTREQWDGLSPAEKFYYSESKEEREMRRIRELREMGLN